MADEKDPRIITPMPQALVDNIDDYRFRERLASRSEAIRRLVALGIGAEPILRDLLALIGRLPQDDDLRRHATIIRDLVETGLGAKAE